MSFMCRYGRERDRETHIETVIYSDGHTHTHNERQTERKRKRDRQREREREREGEREKEREKSDVCYRITKKNDGRCIYIICDVISCIGVCV